MGSTSIDKCPLSEADGYLADRRGGGGNVSLEAETGVMGPQTRELLEPPAAGRGKGQILP